MDQKKIKVKISEEQAKGSYSNFMKVSYNKEEFVLDFANIIPPTGAITSRVIVSPGHLKRIVSTLGKNLKLYEEKHGRIEQSQLLDKNEEIGFKSE